MGPIFFPTQYELDLRKQCSRMVSLYGDNNNQNQYQLQDQPVGGEMFYNAIEINDGVGPNLQTDAEESHPTDVEAIQRPDIEAYAKKMAELCEEPKIKESDERQHENLISDDEKDPQHHPVKAAILNALKEKVASGNDPKEAYVKNGQIRLLFPDVSRKAITRHFNALIKAKLIKRVDRIKYYLHSDNNHK